MNGTGKKQSQLVPWMLLPLAALAWPAWRPLLTIPAGRCGWWCRFRPAAPPISRRAYSE